jgi:hypothetical protein
MRTALAPTAAIVIASLVAVTVSAADSTTLVVCAPGYPGSTAEARPAMDALAGAVTTAAGWPPGRFDATYFETEAGCLDRLSHADAAFALMTLPMFLDHREALALQPLAQAVPAGRAPSEPWSLIAGAGRILGPSDLEGWEIVSLAGHAPQFVRGPALAGWGELPSSVTITFCGAVLSGLREAARGERVALLLDAHQTGALERLPFAGDLEIVHTSQPLPTSLLCAVGDRAGSDRTAELVTALTSLDQRPDAAEALAGVRIDRFDAVDTDRLAAAVATFDGR